MAKYTALMFAIMSGMGKTMSRPAARERTD